MCLWYFPPPSSPPPPPAECFTPTGLSSVLVNKLSIPCAYRRDQYSHRQRVNRVEKLLKPTRGLSRKAKPPTRMENGPGELVYTSGAFPLGFIAPKPICSPNKNKCNSYFGPPPPFCLGATSIPTAFKRNPAKNRGPFLCVA